MIKIAICDDEKYFVDTVEKMLKNYAEKAVTFDGIFKGRISNILFGYRDASNGWHGIGRYHPQT